MKKFARTVAATLIAGALLTTFTACEDDDKDKVVTYDTFLEDLCEDAEIEADKVIFYLFGTNDDEIYFVLYDDTYEDQYKMVYYKADINLVQKIYLDQGSSINQAYPFSQDKLDAFSEIIEKYDPVEVTGPEFNEMYLPWFEEIVNEHCKQD